MIILGEHYELYDHHRYKYLTIKEIEVNTGIFGHNIKTKYFHLQKNGIVIIYVGYAWDGCSGVPDLLSTMLASLIHDIGYQCLREELLIRPEYLWYGCIANEKEYYKEFKKLRKVIDKLFEKIMYDDGAWWITRKSYYRGVRILGEKYALPKSLSDAA